MKQSALQTSWIRHTRELFPFLDTENQSIDSLYRFFSCVALVPKMVSMLSKRIDWKLSSLETTSFWAPSNRTWFHNRIELLVDIYCIHHYIHTRIYHSLFDSTMERLSILFDSQRTAAKEESIRKYWICANLQWAFHVVSLSRTCLPISRHHLM